MQIRDVQDADVSMPRRENGDARLANDRTGAKEREDHDPSGAEGDAHGCSDSRAICPSGDLGLEHLHHLAHLLW